MKTLIFSGLYICLLIALCETSGAQENLKKITHSDLTPEELFDTNKVTDVAFEMKPSDFHSLSNQSRDIEKMLLGDCASKPFPSPYTYFSANLKINNRVVRKHIRIRKKGFVGSISTEKPSLKIDLNADSGKGNQSVAGYKQLYLNNVIQDPALIRTCLAFRLFENAGLLVPRCNFANVNVNGRSLGIYVHVESIDSDFIQRHFPNDNGELFEGNVSDFRPELVGTFKKESNQNKPSRAGIDSLARALTVDDSNLVHEVGKVIDLDRFLTFWGMEVLMNQMDGYSNNINNYFLYHQTSTNKLIFIPFDPELAFYETNPIPVGPNSPVSVFASGVLSRRLFLNPMGQQKYLKRLKELLAKVFTEDIIKHEINRLEKLLSPYGAVDINAFNGVRKFVELQRNKILAELASGPPKWDYPLKAVPCKN